MSVTPSLRTGNASSISPHAMHSLVKPSQASGLVRSWNSCSALPSPRIASDARETWKPGGSTGCESRPRGVRTRRCSQPPNVATQPLGYWAELHAQLYGIETASIGFCRCCDLESRVIRHAWDARDHWQSHVPLHARAYGALQNPDLQIPGAQRTPCSNRTLRMPRDPAHRLQRNPSEAASSMA